MFYTLYYRINFLKAVALLFCCFINLYLTAQIVNIEDRRVNFDSAGWYGQFDLGGNYTKNTSEVFTLRGNLRLDRVFASGQELLFMANYRIVQANGNNFLNAGFGHLRYGHPIKGKLSWEYFTQLQYDEKIQLSLRWLLGTGPRFQLAKGAAGTAYLGVLYMYEYDELRNEATTFRDHRLSTYLSARWNITEGIQLNSTTYYQPRLLTFSQSRLSTSSLLNIELSKKISFNTRINATYDARITAVFPEVPKLTFAWMNGFRWRFGG